VNKPSKPLVAALACILLVLLALGLELLRFAGVFTPAQSRFSGTCRDVPLAGAIEDIQVDAQRGVAYLSFLDRDIQDGPATNGTVMLMDLNLAEPAVRAAMRFDPANFRPQGLSLLRREGQPARLFVTSHPGAGTPAVEIAEQSADGGFVPVATIRDPAFTSPNAIAAAGPGQFYLVNDGPYDPWLRKGDATLVYHDGRAARVLVDDLAYPAGIALGADGTRLYVAEALAKALRVYRRGGDGSLVLEHTVALGSAPGNLKFDQHGLLWMAAHPKLLRLRAHARDPGRRAPTQVLRYDPRSSRVEERYVNDGSQLSAGTVAAPWRDQFLIGALQDKKVLICKPNP
jgi:arylesterase/paraoxonase